MSPAELAAAFESVTAAFTLLKGAVSARDDLKIQFALLDLREKLFNTQTQLLAVVSDNLDLKRQLHEAQIELLDVKKTLKNRGSYSLVSLGVGHALHRAESDSDVVKGDKERPTYFCQFCFQDGREIALSRHLGSSALDRSGWRCPGCSKFIRD